MKCFGSSTVYRRNDKICNNKLDLLTQKSYSIFNREKRLATTTLSAKKNIREFFIRQKKLLEMLFNLQEHVVRYRYRVLLSVLLVRKCERKSYLSDTCLKSNSIFSLHFVSYEFSIPRPQVLGFMLCARCEVALVPFDGVPRPPPVKAADSSPERNEVARKKTNVIYLEYS